MFRSGRIPESQGDTWKDIDLALRIGARGLRPGRSLPQLLAKRRGARNLPGTPPLTEALILKWADRCFRRTGQWPRFNSGEVPGRTGETWAAVDAALRDGTRGLPGGYSLARLLHDQRGVRNKSRLPRLSKMQILAWADDHLRRTGRYPTAESGPVWGAPGETWKAVHLALAQGLRGLPGGSSLARLLAGR
jgi:hypothetical protein